jgi:hypothetical protein
MIGLATKKVAPILSHHNVGVEDRGRCNSAISSCNQTSSEQVSARHRNSDSVLDRATIDCFFEPHEMMLEPR